MATVARVGLAIGWGSGLVALLVPRAAALTALRILVPAGLAAVLAAIVAGTTVDASDVAAVTAATLATAWALAPWIGDAWVDGSSYGPERRLLLRPPALFGYVLAPLAWSVVVAGAVAGPLLLAAHRWVIGAAALLVGWAAVVAGTRSLHQLSRRWVVLVPSGLVIHDPLTMPEAQLFLRRMVSRLGPAPADTTADDLTAGAPGLALKLDLVEPADLLLRTQGRGTTTRSSTAVIFTPSRPRHLLEAAAGSRIPVG
ncbi:MAG: hypothetical protein JWM47_2308 [Acidimicrobiales bacterium]|nr:hypothetical protein [Acidimicrobiales bacterium]